MIMHLVYLLQYAFFFILIARLVMDYVLKFGTRWRPGRGAAAALAEVIYTVTDPPLKALRRVIPPLRIGGIALDLSFLVLIVLVQILAYIALGLGRA